MGKRIVVNAGLIETRVAVQDGNVLTELYVEREGRRSIVGSIYKGVVTNVLPGMQAAFVDIGLAKDAFLYAGDYTAKRGEEEGADLEPDEEEEAVDLASGRPSRSRRVPCPPRRSRSFCGAVRRSRAGLQGVPRDQGARVTSFVSIPAARSSTCRSPAMSASRAASTRRRARETPRASSRA